MNIIMPTGEKEEKTGTVMTNVQTAESDRLEVGKDEHTDFSEN